MNFASRHCHSIASINIAMYLKCYMKRRSKSVASEEVGVFEFLSEIDAWNMLEGLPESQGQLLDMFATTQGTFVLLFVAEAIESLFQSPSVLSQKNILSYSFLKTDPQKSLSVFYRTHTPILKKSLAIVETNSFPPMLKIFDTCWNFSLDIIDFRSQRTDKKNVIYMTGHINSFRKFQDDFIKNFPEQTIQLYSNPSPLLLDFLSAIIPR